MRVLIWYHDQSWRRVTRVRSSKVTEYAFNGSCKNDLGCSIKCIFYREEIIYNARQCPKDLQVILTTGCDHNQLIGSIQSLNQVVPGSRSAPGLELGQNLLIQISPFFSFLQIGLDFAELCQIQCSNFLSFLNLFLVRLDLQ